MKKRWLIFLITATQFDDGSRSYMFVFYLNTRGFCWSQVLEVNEPNNGRDPFPVFCRRGPMPNKPIEVDALGPTKTYSYYCMEDFMVGRTVNIYGRDMFIHDCDEFTKRYLSQVCTTNQPIREPRYKHTFLIFLGDHRWYC